MAEQSKVRMAGLQMMTAQETIRKALSDISFTVQQSRENHLDDIDFSATLPVAELAQYGFTLEVIDNDDADTLPHLLVKSTQGHLEVERSPFAPLALLSGDGTWDGAEVVTILQQVGITPLTPDDFESVPDWYGTPAIDWLFPPRLSEVLLAVDGLREVSIPLERSKLGR